MAFTSIAASAVDAKSPISENLMELIKSNEDDLDARASAVGSFDYQFKINGYLSSLITARKNRLDGVNISKASTLAACRLLLEDAGIGGTLEADIRRATIPNVEITAVQPLFSGAIQSIARAGSAINTQSIARATAQISTQSVALFKTALNINSIVDMGYDSDHGGHIWKINLSGAPDADYTAQSVKLASTAGGSNDGNFTCVRVKDDGGNNVVIVNAGGVAQNSAAGTLQLNMWKYTFTNPVDAHFAAGEIATMASHTAGGNDGALEIYAINQGGNNIIVKNTAGVAQAGVAGNANCNQWYFAASSAMSTTDYVVGEYTKTTSHSTGGNNGSLPIREVNVIGNGLTLYNASGAVQGGAAGTMETQRWVYAFSADPSSDVSAADNVIFYGATTTANNGTFAVKQVNRSAGSNLVIHNVDGVAQGGAVGNVTTSKKKVKFATDQSTNITTDSRIFIVNCPNILEGDYDVAQVNRGGGSNYNAVISTTGTAEQYGPCGRVAIETKSVFDTRPSVTYATKAYNWQGLQIVASSNAVFNATRKIIPGDTLVFADVLSVPTGSKNLTIQLL